MQILRIKDKYFSPVLGQIQNRFRKYIAVNMKQPKNKYMRVHSTFFKFVQRGVIEDEQ